LALLRGWSDLLVDQWPEMEDEVRNEALQTMQEASRDALSQVDELLLEARAEVLSHELQPVPVDLGQLVPQVARQLQGAATPEQRVVGHVAASEAVVLADRQALWQVLWHLGENAIKYSPDGGLIELRVDSAPGRQVVLTVTDEGLGVPTDIDVFAPFSRGTSEQQGNIKGTGLGLHIVHNLLDAMSGTVTAERRETRGSVFRVTLPLMA
jgi:signal transduction histidine kinase